MPELSVVQIETIKDLVGQLHALGVSPLHLQVDAKHVGDTRPDVRLWLRYRTDFERFCAALGIHAKESRWDPEGQRSWSAEHDMEDRRLLVQCVSFKHHADWEPRPAAKGGGDA
jgi:hypothetical protein